MSHSKALNLLHSAVNNLESDFKSLMTEIQQLHSIQSDGNILSRHPLVKARLEGLTAQVKQGAGAVLSESDCELIVKCYKVAPRQVLEAALSRQIPIVGQRLAEVLLRNWSFKEREGQYAAGSILKKHYPTLKNVPTSDIDISAQAKLLFPSGSVLPGLSGKFQSVVSGWSRELILEVVAEGLGQLPAQELAKLLVNGGQFPATSAGRWSQEILEEFDLRKASGLSEFRLIGNLIQKVFAAWQVRQNLESLVGFGKANAYKDLALACASIERVLIHSENRLKTALGSNFLYSLAGYTVYKKYAEFEVVAEAIRNFTKHENNQDSIAERISLLRTLFVFTESRRPVKLILVVPGSKGITKEILTSLTDRHQMQMFRNAYECACFVLGDQFAFIERFPKGSAYLTDSDLAVATFQNSTNGTIDSAALAALQNSSDQIPHRGKWEEGPLRRLGCIKV